MIHNIYQNGIYNMDVIFTYITFLSVIFLIHFMMKILFLSRYKCVINHLRVYHWRVEENKE